MLFLFLSSKIFVNKVTNDSSTSFPNLDGSFNNLFINLSCFSTPNILDDISYPIVLEKGPFHEGKR